MYAMLIMGMGAAGFGMAQEPSSAYEVAAFHPERPIVIAHRGASHGAPENTLAAYQLAIEEGATVAETDVFLTLDGVVVAIHDETLDRTTDGSGPVVQATAADIAQLDAGSWFGAHNAGEPVPTLSGLLGAIGNDLILCIEIKTGVGIVDKIVGLLETHGVRDRVIIFSFDMEQIALAKALMPDVPALFLLDRPRRKGGFGDGPIEAARTLGVDMIGADLRGLTADFVSRAQAAGYPVFVYTVDAPRNVRAAAALGVDGIITNRPRATQDILNALPSRGRPRQ